MASTSDATLPDCDVEAMVTASDDEEATHADGLPRVPVGQRRAFPGLLSEFGGIRRYIAITACARVKRVEEKES